MSVNTSKLIEILDYQSGKVRETDLTPKRMDAKDVGEIMESAIGRKRNRRYTLQEIEEVVGTSEFPTLLRDGIRPILFDAYNMVPATWQLWAQVMQSDKPQENWLEGSTVGYPPIVAEGAPYPQIDLALDRTVAITNQKRGYILDISREMVLFDRVNQIQQMVSDLGRALGAGKEQACYDALTATGNYVRNSTTGDNDYGANTAATTFSALGLVTANNVLTSMKHRRSGRYLGVMPDTLIVAPNLALAAKQLLLSDGVWRVGGNTTNDVYGTGTSNPFAGFIKNIIISPFMVGGNWVLCEAKKFIVVQQVWGPELFQTTNAPESISFMERDTYRYRASEFYGVGMLNDRFAYLSTATAAAIVG